MTPEGFFVFEDWDLIKEKTKFRNVDYNLEGQEYIDLVKVTHFDTSYLRLLSYFLHEIEKLLVLNEKLYKKAEIINMVVRIINYIFDIHNDNNRKSIKYQINKYILDSSSFKYLFQPDQGFQNDFSATLKLRDVDMEDVKEETYEDMLKELDEKEAADEEMGAIDHDNDSEDDDHGNIDYE